MKYLFKLIAILTLLIFPITVLLDYFLTTRFTGVKVTFKQSIKEVWITWKTSIWSATND